jgi:hypothetical protein
MVSVKNAKAFQSALYLGHFLHTIRVFANFMRLYYKYNRIKLASNYFFKKNALIRNECLVK